MIYTDMESLLKVAAQIAADDIDSLYKLKDLIGVYFDALDNPPLGVIGVGAITYAEQALIDHQLDNVEGES